MYEAIVVLNYMVCKKTPVGNVPTYNNREKRIKTISGVSESDCIEKLEEFFKEQEFRELVKP
jgi:hypothetical protein